MSPQKNILPGFHLPLNLVPTSSEPDSVGLPIPNGLNDFGAYIPLTTLREFTMLHFMNKITDKYDWDKHVFDDKIVSRWKSEALSAGEDFTQKMVDWCIDELRYKAQIFHETGGVSVYNGDVVKSDSAVPPSLQQALQAAVKPLEDVPDYMKDWNPDSDKKVLNLVDPSLFPLLYGVSRVLPYGFTTLEDCIRRCGEGEVVPVPSDKNLAGPSPEDPYSRKFQWLPCEVDISREHARITSYINNLHPQRHPDLYDIISQVITHAIPLWNLALAPLLDPRGYFLRINYDTCTYGPDPNEPLGEGGEDGIEDNPDPPLILPEPDVFTVPNEGTRLDLKRKFGSRGLQVIVKLENIELTPEKPTYEGGTWRIEGMMNEHICAIALYYYASENITTSRLAFQQYSGGDAMPSVKHEEGDYDWLIYVFGCEENGPALQSVGSVATRPGRLVAFPNVLQHRERSFRLADATRPGHCKVLELFLVDPHVRIPSTAHVPPQQRAWWHEAFPLPERLPAEIRDKIVADVDGFPFTLNEAKRLRFGLMAELKEFRECYDSLIDEEEIGLTED